MNTTAREALADVIDQYLAGLVTGRAFVRQIDDLVGDDRLTALPSSIQSELARLHESLALCVWDEERATEAPGVYIDESEMRARVEAFRQTLDTSGEVDGQ